MSSKDAYIVPLRSVQREAVARTFHLDNEYFADLDQQEILGGDVKVEMRVRFGFFVAHYNLIGGFDECNAAIALLRCSFVEPKCDESIENVGQPYG